MRDTNPPGLFVCTMDPKHDGPHRAPLIDGGMAMWSDGGAVPDKPHGVENTATNLTPSENV